MAKKCIICNKEATYKIKDTSEYYCPECAEENFADLSLLVKVEDEAQRLKEFIRKKIEEGSSDELENEEQETKTENKKQQEE